MSNWNSQQPFNDYIIVDSATSAKPLAKTYMANVFLWMFAALGISAFFAALFANVPSLLEYLVQVKENGKTGLSILGWLVMLAPLGFVLLMSFGYCLLYTSDAADEL